jgi:uncharacterized repeat protein (TIGR01451 family)
MGLERAHFTWSEAAPASPGVLNPRQYLEPPLSADLRVSGFASPSVAPTGEVVMLRVTVINQGVDTASGVHVEAVLPEGLRTIGADAPQGTCFTSNATVTCVFDAPLPVGSEATMTISGEVIRVSNQSTAIRAWARENDAQPHDNVDSVDVCGACVETPQIWINEFHYDDITLFDADEGVEIAGAAGTVLAGFRLLLYDGASGTMYRSVPLSGQIDDEGKGYGAVWIPIDGIQNGKLLGLGSGDGIALAPPCIGTTHFVSYEGALVAADEQSAGQSSEDIGVDESDATPVGTSLQLTGFGTEATDFAWTGPATNSPGLLNAGQDLPPIWDPDQDGIPSEWETRYFGHPTAADPDQDPDHDGSPNLQEYIADTDPTDISSCFRIHHVRRDSAGSEILFYTSTERFYTVECSTGWTEAEWAPIADMIPGTGGLQIFSCTNQFPDARFRASVHLSLP